MKIDVSLNQKQATAFRFLIDSVSTDIVYGGGAGSGKSFLGCAWLIIGSQKYPGTRWLMGRSKLKALEETTLVTFFDVCSKWGIQNEVHYKYNSKKNFIQFVNGSIILLKDLFAYPSDPEFDSLGSLEITGAFIDEASQVTSKAKEIVRSRIRYKLDEFCPSCAAKRDRDLDDNKMWRCKCGNYTKGLTPKILMTCNPSKGWLYSEFYVPWKEDRLSDNKKFVHALVTDNPNIQSSYVDNLNSLTGQSRERLLEGNWEYDDDARSLVEYDAIMDLFSNPVPGGKRFITADIARQGRDKTVIIVWDGFRAEVFIEIKKNKIDTAAEIINNLRFKYKVHTSDIYVDEDGVGGGVVDILGCNGVVNNSSPVFVQGQKENFGNLKSQLYFYLAKYINDRKIAVHCTPTQRDMITQEIEWVRRHNADKDGKFYITPKDEVKANIGRSPDYSDAMAYRMLPELKNFSRWL